ncbi:MAG: DUF4272 domain-containing protein [Anaerolineae bacterium]|nr:DUF4272 domain-containing protein [Anaerolineae bacterium]
MSHVRIQDERAVAYRVLSLGALLKRAELERTIRHLHELFPFSSIEELIAEQEEYRQQLLRWLEAESIVEHLSESESSLLMKPLGTWSERTLLTVEWRTEALGILLWALGHLEELPSYDRQFDPEVVLEPLDLLTPTIDLIWMAQVRPEEELIQRRDQAELWNWRSRATELERMGVRPPAGVTFRQIIASTAEMANTKGHIPTLLEHDFPAFERPYAQLNEDQYMLVSAITYERYTAFNWLCEYSNKWESVRVDS